MEDRGEKIVNLAREMLRTGFAGEAPVPAPLPRDGVPIKALFLAAFLAAFGGSLVTQAFDAARRPIDGLERAELNALVAYAAQTRSLDQAALCREIRADLSIADLDNLTVRDYLLRRLR